MRAIFEPALNVKSWRSPAGREVAIFKDEDRKKADEIEKEAVKIDQERLKKQAHYIEETFQKQLAKLPKELHEPLKAAHSTPGPKRSPEQKKLLQAHPSVNVTDGSLYLYDGKAAADLKSIAERAAKLRATKPTPDFIRALTEIPGQVPTTHLFERGDHEQPTQVVAPAGLMIFEPFGISKIPDRSPRPADDRPTSGLREDSHLRQASVDRARSGQPPLAESFRQGHRQHPWRLRHPRRTADASRTARLAGAAISWPAAGA